MGNGIELISSCNLDQIEYKSEKTVNDRNYGLDLLKIMLTLLIVAGHFTLHGVKTLNAPLFEEYYMSMLGISAVCMPAVNVFFLISGYFGIKSNVVKFSKLIEPMYLIGIGVALGAVIFSLDVGISFFVKSFLFPFEIWWFATVYLILFLASKYLHIIYNILSDKELFVLIIGLVILNTVQGFLFEGKYYGNGFSIMQAVLMYTLGAGIKRFVIKVPGKFLGGGIYLVCSALVFAGRYIIEYYGFDSVGTIFNSYSNPVVIVQAIALFSLFKSILFKNEVFQRITVFFSTSTLITYLLTDHYMVRKILYSFPVDIIDKYGYPISTIFITAVLCLIVATLFEKINTLFLSIIIESFKKCDSKNKYLICVKKYNSHEKGAQK